MAERKQVTITVELSEQHALALAQFVKRVTFSGVRECAVDDDEAYAMLHALEQVRAALAEKGWAPR